MTDEKWEEIVGRIKDTFSVEDEREEPLDGQPGTRRLIVFRGPAGRIKLEYTNAPVVLGTHGLGSRRIGGATTVAYEYSTTERRGTFTASRWENEEWVPVDEQTLLGGL